ncbi:MAG: hypothetical protein AB7O24_15785 [Kofleriaceae bacterium]
MKRWRWVLWIAAAATLPACDDGLDQRLSIIRDTRVLAVIAEPAEAKPGALVEYQAVIASPSGPPTQPPAWAFCTAPKPPTEDNAVSVECIGTGSQIDLGVADRVTGVLPADGCLRFGPDTPPGGFRPRAADATGGYYQPVKVTLDDELAFGLSRITCKLPAAPAELARRYDVDYVANRNPTFAIDAPAIVTANTDVPLTASWPADSVESYLFFEPSAQALLVRRESMHVSWYASGGALAVDGSLVDEQDVATQVTTTWHTPDPGQAWLWFVLRDSRGGVATHVVPITVE